MEIKKGKRYIFEYIKFKHSFDKGVTVYEKQIIIEAFLPVDYDENLIIGWVLLKVPKIKKLKNLIYEECKNDYSILIYVDEIKLTGKHKWRLISEDACKVTVSDLPDLIECSLNVFDHPKKRNWFLVKNCGFTEEENIRVDWHVFESLEMFDLLVDTRLYYKLLVESTLVELSQNKIIYNSITELEEIIYNQYILNGHYKMKPEYFKQIQEDFLKDISKLWDYFSC